MSKVTFTLTKTLENNKTETESLVIDFSFADTSEEAQVSYLKSCCIYTPKTFHTFCTNELTQKQVIKLDMGIPASNNLTLPGLVVDGLSSLLVSGSLKELDLSGWHIAKQGHFYQLINAANANKSKSLEKLSGLTDSLGNAWEKAAPSPLSVAQKGVEVFCKQAQKIMNSLSSVYSNKFVV